MPVRRRIVKTLVKLILAFAAGCLWILILGFIEKQFPSGPLGPLGIMAGIGLSLGPPLLGCGVVLYTSWPLRKLQAVLRWAIYLVVSAGLALGSLFGGNAIRIAFSMKGQSVEARRQYTIQEIQQQNLPNKNAIQSKFHQDILTVLLSATAQSLKQATIASAFLVEDTKRMEWRLNVFWFSEQPLADAIEFDCGDQADPIILPMTAASLKWMAQQAKICVRFTGGGRWEYGSAVYARLRKPIPASDVRIRLLQEKRPITGWGPVDVYRADGAGLPKEKKGNAGRVSTIDLWLKRHRNCITIVELSDI